MSLLLCESVAAVVRKTSQRNAPPYILVAIAPPTCESPPCLHSHIDCLPLFNFAALSLSLFSLSRFLSLSSLPTRHRYHHYYATVRRFFWEKRQAVCKGRRGNRDASCWVRAAIVLPFIALASISLQTKSNAAVYGFP